MRRIIVLHLTGTEANNMTIARRILRKILGAQKKGECLLIDFEDVDVSIDFLSVLASAAQSEKIKFCGLPPIQQRLAKSLKKGPTI